jgi:hypothetical protein
MHTEILVGKPEDNRPLGRPWHQWEDNIKVYFKEIGRNGKDCIHLAQDSGQVVGSYQHGNELLFFTMTNQCTIN